jgi:DNA-binding SARP family transcriptional activator
MLSEYVVRVPVVRRARAAQNGGMNDRIEINVCAGTAYRGAREIELTDGEFVVAAAFALQRRHLSREAWCDRLWPERDEASAARLLKVYVHRVRAKFGTDAVIETCAGGYRIGAGVRVDVSSLETLARSRWSATRPLDAAQRHNVQRAFDGITARRYERLARLPEYPDVERRCLAAGGELGRLLIDDALARSATAYAVAVAEDLAGLDPYDETAAELLIRTQLQAGRREMASRSFRTYCRTLRDDLDLPPPPRLAQLFRATG